MRRTSFMPLMTIFTILALLWMLTPGAALARSDRTADSGSQEGDPGDGMWSTGVGGGGSDAPATAPDAAAVPALAPAPWLDVLVVPALDGSVVVLRIAPVSNSERGGSR
jgi:hypothetical protein